MKREPMTDAELLAAIGSELASSSTSSGSEFQINREDANRYYKLNPNRARSHVAIDEEGEVEYELFPDQKEENNAPEGRSNAESPDIQSMVDQTISQIMPRFRRPTLAVYEPNSMEDDDQAQAESRTINKMVLHDGNGYEVVRGALFDASLAGVCATVVYWDAGQKATIETYPDPYGLISDETLQAALGGNGDETLSVLKHEDGVATVRRLAPRGELCLKPIPLEFLRLSGDADNVDADKMRFIGYEGFASVDELVDQGVPYDTAASLMNAGGKEDVDDNEFHDFEHSSGDESNANKQLVECWYRIDFDGDGRAERRHIRYSGTTILHNEEVSDEVDIVVGVAMHQPHRPYGHSFYNKLQQTQDLKREVLRQAIDSGRLAIDNRWLAEKDAIDLETMTHSRAGGIVLAEPGMFDKVMPLNNQDNFASALNLLQYQDKIRSEVGGNALDMAGENSPVPGSTAHGVERIITSREQFVAEISETFARTYLKRLFVVIHRVLRRHGAPVKLEWKGQTQVVSAATFPPRNEVSVDLGPTRAQQAARQQALSLTVERQVQPEVQALGIVGPQQVYDAMIDLADAFELPASEKYWIDPSSNEGGIQQENLQLKQQMQEMGMQLQQMQMVISQFQQAQMELEQAKLLQKDKEAMAKLDFQYAELGEKTDIDEQQLDLDEEELEMKYDEQISRNEA